MPIALTRPVSAAITQCALTFLEREPIDPTRALAQHAAYERCLASLGVRVISLPPEPELPDAAFVEDTVVVTDEVAVITRPKLPSRQREVESVARALAAYRPVHRITAPGTLEGGDVLRIGRTFYVGISARSNAAGAGQLAALLAPHGYEVVTVPVAGCLHLKTAATYLGGGIVLGNPAWADLAALRDVRLIEVPPAEPFAANTLRLNGTVLMPASHRETGRLLERAGFGVTQVDVSELEKAEAGVTCCSVLFAG